MVVTPAGKRQAAFVCAMVLCLPDGSILEDRRGALARKHWIRFARQNGFGYDPIFHSDGRDETPAMITNEEKTTLSHRGQARRKNA